MAGHEKLEYIIVSEYYLPRANTFNFGVKEYRTDWFDTGLKCEASRQE